MRELNRIIVADDEPFQRLGLRKILERLTPGSEIIECSHGHEVLTQINRSPVDLVITDIRMPLMDGIDVARMLALSHPTIKLVFVSAYEEFGYAKLAIDNGVQDYILSKRKK